MKFSIPSQYPRTRAFVEKHGLFVPDLFKTDSCTSEQKVQRPKRLRPPDRSGKECNTAAGASKISRVPKGQGTKLSVNRAAYVEGEPVKTPKPTRPRHSHEHTENFEDDLDTEVWDHISECEHH